MARYNGWKLLHCRPLGLTLIIFLCDVENLSFIFAQDGTPPPGPFRLPTRGRFVPIYPPSEAELQMMILIEHP
jgi:hypothetical protein